jgi:hypothetical protein
VSTVEKNNKDDFIGFEVLRALMPCCLLEVTEVSEEYIVPIFTVKEQSVLATCFFLVACLLACFLILKMEQCVPMKFL